MNAQASTPGTRVKIILLVFAIIGAFFVVAEHRVHVIPYLPWLLLAACPLMHLFMHHGHGNHERHDTDERAAGSPRHPNPGDRS